MAITTKKLKKGINTNDFISKVYHLTKRFQAIQDKYNNEVDLLAKKYMAANCSFKVGDNINIKDSTEGFKVFTIEKLFPEIKWDDRTIRIKAYGIMTGEGKEDTQKMIWLDELKKSEPKVHVELLTKPENAEQL